MENPIIIKLLYYKTPNLGLKESGIITSFYLTKGESPLSFTENGKSD
jgi:hypothetical protein